MPSICRTLEAVRKGFGAQFFSAFCVLFIWSHNDKINCCNRRSSCWIRLHSCSYFISKVGMTALQIEPWFQKAGRTFLQLHCSDSAQAETCPDYLHWSRPTRLLLPDSLGNHWNAVDGPIIQRWDRSVSLERFRLALLEILLASSVFTARSHLVTGWLGFIHLGSSLWSLSFSFDSEYSLMFV